MEFRCRNAVDLEPKEPKIDNQSGLSQIGAIRASDIWRGRLHRIVSPIEFQLPPTSPTPVPSISSSSMAQFAHVCSLTLPGRSTTASKPSPRPDNKPSPRWTAKPTMPGRGRCLKSVTVELFQRFRKVKKRIPIRDRSPVELVTVAE